MKKITVYGMPLCVYCQDAKAYFTEKNWPFEYLEVDGQKIKELEEKTGIDTVPQIFIESQFIGGWITTKKLLDSGEFETLLQN